MSGLGNASPSQRVKTYDEIRDTLDTALYEAIAAHENEVLNRHYTHKLLAEALDRYNRFILHGIIPEGIGDDERL